MTTTPTSPPDPPTAVVYASRAEIAQQLTSTHARLTATVADSATDVMMSTQLTRLPTANIRAHAQQALGLLDDVATRLATVSVLLESLAELCPPAHDDDLAGSCLCGRPADTCPARQAAADGSSMWTDETGQVRAIDDPAQGAPPLPPEPPLTPEI